MDHPIWTRGRSRWNRRHSIDGEELWMAPMRLSVGRRFVDQIDGGGWIGGVINRRGNKNEPDKTCDAITRRSSDRPNDQQQRLFLKHAPVKKPLILNQTQNLIKCKGFGAWGGLYIYEKAWRPSAGPLVYMECDRPRAYTYKGQSHQKVELGLSIYPF